MRICVLEWISSGGLYRNQLSDIPCGLQNEGRAMLECMCMEWSRAGHQVSTVVDSRLINNAQRTRLSHDFVTLLDFHRILKQQPTSSGPGQSVDATLSVWLGVAMQNDLTLVVAPEMDGILEYCIGRMVQAGVTLMNATGQFLKIACDKMLTAEYLHRLGLPHPQTWLATDFPIELLTLSDLWCFKPRWGAGCEGLGVLDSSRLRIMLPELIANSQCLLQPWIKGSMYSCSAIVDFSGQWSWMPLVTQEFSITRMQDQTEKLCYLGARLASNSLQQIKPTELLDITLKALSRLGNEGPDSYGILEDSNLVGKDSNGRIRREALGWIGVDLVLDAQQQWTVIEVNARLTTSIVELSRTGNVHLARQMLKGYNECNL